jgi:hypothetical protein
MLTDKVVPTWKQICFGSTSGTLKASSIPNPFSQQLVSFQFCLDQKSHKRQHNTVKLLSHQRHTAHAGAGYLLFHVEHVIAELFLLDLLNMSRKLSLNGSKSKVFLSFLLLPFQAFQRLETECLAMSSISPSLSEVAPKDAASSVMVADLQTRK